MFFWYDQNNSGGVFIKPAQNVIIEADTVDEANIRSEDLGVYFNGVITGDDCECCGDRWYRPWNDDGHSLLEMIKRIESERDISTDFKQAPFILIYFKNGTKKEFTRKADIPFGKELENAFNADLS